MANLGTQSICRTVCSLLYILTDFSTSTLSDKMEMIAPLRQSLRSLGRNQFFNDLSSVFFLLWVGSWEAILI